MIAILNEKRICKKCGEIYILYHDDLWQIFRTSGIPYVKDEYSVALCEDGVFFYFPPSPLKMNSRYFTYYVNYHDEAALKEIDNNRCIMKGCDGKLEKFEGNEFEDFEKKRDLNYHKYFGEDDDDLNETKDTSTIMK